MCCGRERGGAHGDGARRRQPRGMGGGGVGAVGGRGGGGQVAGGEGAPAPQAAQQAGCQEHRGGWRLLVLASGA